MRRWERPGLAWLLGRAGEKNSSRRGRRRRRGSELARERTKEEMRGEGWGGWGRKGAGVGGRGMGGALLHDGCRVTAPFRKTRAEKRWVVGGVGRQFDRALTDRG
uniref:Uncharacterized protein n=1 Tax=Oryza punctata TaxID=4537 RepID=A0A0E0M4W3_ORYPU